MQKVTMAAVLLLIVFVFSIHPAVASPIIDSADGKLNGYTGVLVNGSYYNVSFIDGSFNTIFIGQSISIFNGWPDARAAAQALLDQVFTLDYDMYPSLTRGITDIDFGTILTPFMNVDFAYYYFTVNSSSNPPVPINDYFDGYDPVDYDFDTKSAPSKVWAVWEPAAPVPEPSTMLLLGSGLIGLVVFRKKRRV